ncbi:unnamed protein product [Candida verbasci]|uniref:Smr domain-containing protein n=1 Tax=Candida verbasci TaxID=1227364 RepID=A0A9W4XN42_9ASCO|nr:unnamed protein product [Candida verbasci]
MSTSNATDSTKLSHSKLKPPIHNPQYKFLKYGTISDLKTLRKANPYYYKKYYYLRDCNNIGTIILKNGIKIGNRELYLHLKYTLMELDYNSLLKKGIPYDSIIFYLCGILKLPMSTISLSLSTTSPIELVENSIKETKIPEKGNVSARYNSFLKFIRIDLLRKIVTRVKDEGLILLTCCLLSKELYQLIIESHVKEVKITSCQKEKEVKKKEVKKPKKEITTKTQSKDPVSDNIMANLKKDVKKLHDMELIKGDDTEVESLEREPEESEEESEESEVEEEVEELDQEQYQVTFPLFKPVELSKDDLDSLDIPLSESESEIEPEHGCNSNEEEQPILRPTVFQPSSANNVQFPISSSNSNLEDTYSTCSPPTSIEPEDNNENSQAYNLNEEDYQEYMFDSQDLDSNFIYIIETLTDLFPRIKKTEIKIRLKIANSLDELIEELWVETESLELIEQEKEKERENQIAPVYDIKVYQLFEIFPNLELEYINEVLISKNNNIEETTMTLLSNPTESFNPTSSQGSSSTTSKTFINEWVQSSQLINKINSFFNKLLDSNMLINDEDVAFWLRKCNYSINDTIIAIVMNVRPQIKTKVTKRGSKVQRGNTSKKSNPTTEFKYIKSSYKYNPKSVDSVELWDICETNAILKKFNSEFVKNSLEFFQGNVYKAIEFISELSNIPEFQNNTKQTPIFKFAPTIENDPFINLSKKFNHFYSKPTSLNHSKIDENQRFQNYIRKGEVDLHRLKVPEALRLTKIVLEHWWDEEIKNRELIGKMNKFGHLASLGPISIITGRGIHSSNGVSIIKKIVKDYLTKNKYIFDEEVGGFDVKGKKSKVVRMQKLR